MYLFGPLARIWLAVERHRRFSLTELSRHKEVGM
jgi:hypothetical protein